MPPRNRVLGIFSDRSQTRRSAVQLSFVAVEKYRLSVNLAKNDTSAIQ